MINLLGDYETEYKETGVFDTAYDTRQKALKGEIEDFILTRIAELHSTEAVSELEGIIKEIDTRIKALLDEYDKKVKESVKARKTREKALSDKLLNSEIDIPMFPDFVKKAIKKRFLVKDVNEASTVSDALFQIALHIIKVYDFKPEQNNSKWQEFLNIIKVGGWDYLNRMAEQYRKDKEKIPLLIGVCPHCNVKLIRDDAPGKEILRCPSCNSRWTLPKKD